MDKLCNNILVFGGWRFGMVEWFFILSKGDGFVLRLWGIGLLICVGGVGCLFSLFRNVGIFLFCMFV